MSCLSYIESIKHLNHTPCLCYLDIMHYALATTRLSSQKVFLNIQLQLFLKMLQAFQIVVQ